MKKTRFFLGMFRLAISAGFALSSCKKKTADVEGPVPGPGTENPVLVPNVPLTIETLHWRWTFLALWFKL